jgi:hypothetical protein
MVVTVIFRPMLCGLQPKSKTPVDYRKAFLMTREMVFMCVIGCFIPSLSQSSAAHSRHHRSSANHQRRAFVPLQDPVHVHSLIIFYYIPIAQSPTLGASRAACERVGARVVQINRKLERLWNSKRSTSISTFRFLSNHSLLRCHRTHLVYVFHNRSLTPNRSLSFKSLAYGTACTRG